MDDPNYSFGLLRIHPLEGYLADVFINYNAIRIQGGYKESTFNIQSWNETKQELQLIATNDSHKSYEITVTRHQVDCTKSGLGWGQQQRIFEIIKLKIGRVDPEMDFQDSGILYLVSQHDLPDVPEGYEH